MIIPSSHSTSTVCILLLRILLLLLSSKKDTNNVVQAALPCSTTAHCESVLRPGSECVDGECTNPYYKGGCLKQRLADKWKKTRVCHSEDPPEARLLGYCIPPDPDFDYLEIRVATQDWESAFFQSWVIQIILSEILGIPVTLESGTAEDIVDFYHPGSPLGYGKSYDYEAIERANDVGDCRLFDKFNKDGEYQSCAHILPEIWYGQQAKTGKLFDDGIITRPGHMGALGHQGLYVPIFTGAKDPTLLTYLGLAGEENRRKLAETFLRPTKWKDYCEQVSTTNCTDGGDSTATRPPKHEAEGNRFFVEGLFNGYFRATGKNDCDKNPATCTGHVVDYPCGWTSFVQQQLYHLNIALESDGDEPISNGYTYSQMTEIWAAANATKSNVILQWWTPEALYQTFLGTEAEFQRVSLRPPTEDCVKARIDLDNRCDPNANDTLRYGTKEGSCDEPPYSLERIIASSLEKITNDPSVPEETRSPGYQTIMNIKLTGLQIGKIFDYWLKRNSDKYNFDPRDA